MPKPAKILIVDANENAVLQMAQAFHQEGWNTITAGDGLIAQSVVRKEIPDIIVLSSSLPGGGALFAIKRIRSSAHTVATPVVVIARLQGIRDQEFLHAGASAFIETRAISPGCVPRSRSCSAAALRYPKLRSLLRKKSSPLPSAWPA